MPSANSRAQYLHNWVGPFVDQVVGTAFLVASVFALVDQRNQPPKANLAPLLIGFVVVAVGISFGANAGYAINPARDFGPRLFAWIAGWGEVAIPGNYANVSGLPVDPDRRAAARRTDRRRRVRPRDPRHATRCAPAASSRRPTPKRADARWSKSTREPPAAPYPFAGECETEHDHPLRRDHVEQLGRRHATRDQRAGACGGAPDDAGDRPTE